ncbi:hypothetical protein NQ318_002346 [Aromia moschata]|uniref:Uncharacterized protein n=1 Tax=Aromia moschata TaxID=1265417 RepID=A0AAV8XFY7_9CUCU|nr:hypothetical protein NQ318_002346 [Aromia moschata]
MLKSNFLHECVDDLLGKRIANFDNYNSGDIEWTKDDYDKTRKCVQHLYRQCIIENNFHLDKEISPNLEEAIRNCYEIRKDAIFQWVAKECVLNLGHNLVDNIDWKLKWILGTSDLATVREPLLQRDGAPSYNYVLITSFQTSWETSKDKSGSTMATEIP